MPINISSLKTELTTDPRALGYSGAVNARDLNRLQDLLNTRGLGGVADTVTVGSTNAFELQQLVVPAEYLVLTQAQRDLWNCLITTGTTMIALSNALIRQQVGAVWSVATVTRSNIVSAQLRPASRVEVLFGENATADTNVIYLALQ